MYLMQVRDIDANVAGISCFSSYNSLNINQLPPPIRTKESDNTEPPQIINYQFLHYADPSTTLTSTSSVHRRVRLRVQPFFHC